MQARVAHACAHLAGDLDGEQVQLYDLALCRAELDGAQALAQFALNEGVTSDFLGSIASTNSAQVLLDVHARLVTRPADFGLRVQDLALPDTGDRLSASRLAEIGRQFIARQQDHLPDGLDAEKRMMRDSFEQFGRDVVMPRASDIHRGDLIIPDAILDPLREMGCFGLSVPTRFGGLKPDDHEDSLGMVVVTQALSRASLGAAGSLITRPEIMARAIMEGGTAEQQARWLPGLAAGHPLCAISVTEPDTGSDVAAVTLKAERVPGGRELVHVRQTVRGREGLQFRVSAVAEVAAVETRMQHQVFALAVVRDDARFGVEKFEHERDVFQFRARLDERGIA